MKQDTELILSVNLWMSDAEAGSASSFARVTLRGSQRPGAGLEMLDACKLSFLQTDVPSPATARHKMRNLIRNVKGRGVEVLMMIRR